MAIVYTALWVVAVSWCVCLSAADKWRWPDQNSEGSIRIDSKVRFVDSLDSTVNDRRPPPGVQADEESGQDFRQTEMYSDRRPTAAHQGTNTYGQYVNYRDRRPQAGELLSAYQAAENSLQQCKCTTDTRCSVRNDIPHGCGQGQHVCCYRRQDKVPQNSDLFNEINDNPLFNNGDFTSQGINYFEPNRHSNGQAVLVGPNGQTGKIGSGTNRPVLVSPDGPTGIIGPGNNRPVLVGPDGPTGIIGPASVIKPGRKPHSYNNPDVLVGPDGPTGIIGPNNGVLTGPGGPTGIIGPQSNRRPHTFDQSQGQNLIQNPGVLVGPDGPTGIVGPHSNRRPNAIDFQGPNNFIQSPEVLVGPGGPTGIIGPKPINQAVLVGPDGPTGLIGPNKPDVLVGPNGPTGIIGPYGNVKNPGILVGPGGRTGSVGPRGGERGVLVGPGGPTGLVGPQQHRDRGILVGPGGPTGNIGPGRGYGLLSSRQSYSDYFGSRTPIYRGGDRNY